jgi:hypothetical protein
MIKEFYKLHIFVSLFNDIKAPGRGGKKDYSRLYYVNSKNILLNSSVTKMFIEK